MSSNIKNPNICMYIRTPQCHGMSDIEYCLHGFCLHFRIILLLVMIRTMGINCWFGPGRRSFQIARVLHMC